MNACCFTKKDLEMIIEDYQERITNAEEAIEMFESIISSAKMTLVKGHYYNEESEA